MHFGTFLGSTAALLSLVAAQGSSGCLTDQQHHKILARWISIFTKLDEKVVKTTVKKDVKLYSDSLDFLNGSPPGSITGVPFWDGRDALVTGQQSAQSDRDSTVDGAHFTTLQSTFGCNTIVFHWRIDGTYKGSIPGSTTVAGDPYGFAGIDYLIIDTSTVPCRVQTAYSEINLGELLYTSGYPICFQKNANVTCAPA